MSYADYEYSTDSGSPIEAYIFTEGLNTYRYCNAAEDVTIGAITYTATQVSRSGIELTDDVSKGEISITFPRDHEFASRFLGGLNDSVTVVNVMRFHATDPTSAGSIQWKGRVVAAKANTGVIELTCESVFTSLRRHGLRARFQRNCRHALYGYDCGLNQTSFEVNGSVIGFTGNTVTVTEAGLQSSGYYVGGLLRVPEVGSRLIVGHTGSTLTLARPMESLTVGRSVKISPGCDHLLTTCTSKFNNQANFGGYPYIPIKNPFSGTSIV